MAARSIASLSLSFGLVSIPVKVFSATETSSGVHFNMLHNCGSRLRQQYMCIKEDVVVDRADVIKGYEFEKDRYVTFTAAELKALEESAQHTIDIVAFVPAPSVDPIYYDKAYHLAPDKRGAKPYRLLLAAMQASGRCALARWVWKGKRYVVQVRPGADDGLILQQLLYADEVRSAKDLDIEAAEVKPAELQLALQLIEQIAADGYDPAEYKDDERARVLAAIDAKIAGKEVVVTEAPAGGDAKIIDLTEALRASLAPRKAAAKVADTAPAEATAPPARKAAKRAAPTAAVAAAEPAPRPRAARK